jgi:hypothetical protein
VQLACNLRLFHLIQALAGPDAVPTGSGTGITTHDTSIVTISGEQPDAQASPQPGRITISEGGSRADVLFVVGVA